MAIRENVDEPEEITNQSVAVPGASCLFESELIVEERIYTKVDQFLLLDVLTAIVVAENGSVFQMDVTLASSVSV